MHLKRHDDWARRLNVYLTESTNKPYEMGSWDCCMFAAGAVDAITGTDPMAEFRGKYTEETFDSILEKLGAGNLYNTLCAKFGPPVAGAHGQRGDIAFYEGCCGVIIGRVAIFLFEKGYGRVPITKLDCAFKIGVA